MNAPAWTETQTEALRRYVAMGATASQIARLIQPFFKSPLTRNSIIGKCNRMNLRLGETRAPELADVLATIGELPSTRSNQHVRRQEKKAPRPRVERKAAPAVEIAPPPVNDNTETGEPLYVSLLALRTGECRYPVNNSRFCGATAVEGHSWCRAHYSVVYRVNPIDKFRMSRRARQMMAEAI